jgi:hypothetical protein
MIFFMEEGGGVAQTYPFHQKNSGCNVKGLKDSVPWQVESYVEYTIAEGGRAGDTVQV